MLTKEKLDRQLTGQSSAPFMKATSTNDSHSSQSHQKKGVMFDTIEMLERNSNCIDQLTSLVSDLKMTMDRKQPQYKPKIYGTTTGQVIGVVITQIIIDKVTRDLTRDRTHNGLLEIEVRVEVEMKILAMIRLEVEVEIEIKGEERNLDLDLIQG